jgi:MFS family permease
VSEPRRRPGVSRPVFTPAERQSVRAYLLSRLAGAIAGAALTTALGKQVFDLTHRELDLGWLGLAEFTPALVLLLLTGALADKVDRRLLVAVGVLGQAAFSGLLAWYAGTDPTSVGPIFALVVGFGIARAFTMPSSRALPADIVAREYLPWITVRFSATWQIAMIAGPVIGGVLYAVDVTVPYIVVAVLLAASAALMGFVRLRTEPEEAVVLHAEPEASPSPGGRWHEALEGLRFIRRQPTLLGMISLDLWGVLVGGGVARPRAIADPRLDVGAAGLGLLRAAYGIGAGVTTLAIAVRPVQRHVGLVMFAAVGTFGAATIVLGATTSFVVAFVALMVLSGADSVSVFVRSTLLPLVTPADKRGRVLGVEMMFIGASNELGAFESGVTGQLMGPAAAVITGGAATMALTAGWMAMFPTLRKLDRFPGINEPRVVEVAGASDGTG